MSYNDTVALLTDIEYQYQLRHKDEWWKNYETTTGYSEPSDIGASTPLDDLSPPKVSGVAAIYDEEGGYTYIEWNPVDDSTLGGYWIKYIYTATKSEQMANDAPLERCFHRFIVAPPQTGALELRARAMDRSENSGTWSDGFCIGEFLRGDANADGKVTGADGTFIINYIYRGGPPPPCMDAGDANDDGLVTGGDASYITKFVYQGGPPPPEPYPNCGFDPTLDKLDCASHPPCMGTGSLASGSPEFGGNLWLGEATLTEDKLTVPVYLENIKTLHLFGWKVDYDPQLLTAERVDSSGLITEKFDFFGANKNLGEGWVKAGALTSWTMEWVLPPGSYQIATMVFKSKADGIDVTQVLSLSDIELVDPNGNILRAGTAGGPMSSSLITAPYAFRLLQSQPNPFTTEATIAYSIPKTSRVCLKIYASSGRLVRTLINEEKDPGYYTAHWDGKTDNGKEVSSGVYFYRIAIRPEGEAGSHKATRKLVRVR